MGISNDMKKLREDIVADYDVRVKAIGVLVKDTHKMLKGFQAEHKEMATNLRGELAKGEEKRLKGEEQRLKDFRVTMANIQKFVSDLDKEVSAMIERFQKEHKVMADKLKENAVELKENLEKGEADRLKTFNDMMGNIHQDINQIETYVANKLKEFSDAHAGMSEELKKMLAQYVADMVKATKNLMGDIQKRQKERTAEIADLNAEVADLLDAFKTEREKMAANWQALTATMAKKRGIKPKVEAEVKVRPVKEAIKEAIEEIEEEVTPDMDLDEKILQFIKKHPKGVRVGDMEETLGVVRMRLGVIAKKLLEEGKIRKEENMYFPL
jgi:gas vesicle protein